MQARSVTGRWSNFVGAMIEFFDATTSDTWTTSAHGSVRYSSIIASTCQSEETDFYTCGTRQDAASFAVSFEMPSRNAVIASGSSVFELISIGPPGAFGAGMSTMLVRPGGGPKANG